MPVVEELALQPVRGSALTSTTSRAVLLDPIVQAAVKAASKRVTERPDVAPGAFQVEGQPDERRAWVSVPAGADERVLQVARLYRQSLAAGVAHRRRRRGDPAPQPRAGGPVRRPCPGRGPRPPVEQVIRKLPGRKAPGRKRR